MKIFVINLERRTDRRVFMEQQLQKLGLEAEFIHAVDGAHLSEEEQALYDEPTAVAFNGRPFALGEIGCTLSHRVIYERMVREKIPQALILEDDVSLSEDVSRIIADKEFLASTQWSWLQINYVKPGWPFFSGWLRSSGIEIRRKPLFLFYALLKLPVIAALSLYEGIREALTPRERPRIVHFPRPLYLAGCYILTLEGAEMLLPIATPLRYTSDRLPNEARKNPAFRMRAVAPLLVRQERDMFYSDLDTMGW